MGGWSDRIARWRQLLARGVLFRYAVGTALVATGLSTRFMIRREGYQLRFYPSALSLTLWAMPNDRDADERFVRKWLRAGECYLDVGANIGTLALAASRAVGPQGRVIAVEAHPRTYSFLLGNIALNACANVTAVHTAVGEATSPFVYFTDRRSDDQNQLAGRPTTITVPLRRLDDLDLPCERVSLLKIDVEGHERAVLNGAPRCLGRTDAVYFEAWERHFQPHGHSTADLVSLLAHAGFVTYGVRNGHLLSIGPEYVARDCENLIAVRPASVSRLNEVIGA